jgi:DNA-binding IclR family transcriptional regulator
VSFPAWFQFHRDKVMQKHPAACTVYASILGLDNIFWQPRPIKTWLLAEGLGMRKKTVRQSLNLLVKRGYLVEHPRGDNQVRTFTVAMTREAADKAPAQ